MVKRKTSGIEAHLLVRGPFEPAPFDLAVVVSTWTVVEVGGEPALVSTKGVVGGGVCVVVAASVGFEGVWEAVSGLFATAVVEGAACVVVVGYPNA